MLSNKIGYSYNDITLVPCDISNISSRSECNPYINKNIDSNSGNFLPIFTAPMASVVNERNIYEFYNNGIIGIVPRNIDLEIRIKMMNDQHWVALSLKEFKDLFVNNYTDRIGDFRTHYFICVDIANGHMISLYDLCSIAKKNAIAGKYKLTIMTGNIANAKTYEWICKNAIYRDTTNNDLDWHCAIDYIRVGIGGGHGCITTSNTSIHYPQASLIDECYNVKQNLDAIGEYVNREWKPKFDWEFPKIVADGGIRNYDHVIKALALGADYVMIGSLFAQCIESAGIKTTKSTSAKVPLRFPIERYKDFSIDHKGNFKAYYTDEFINENLNTWKDDLDKADKKVEAGELDKNDAEYKLAVLQHNKRLAELQEEKFIGSIDVKFFGMASADGQKSINGKKTKTAEGITKYLPVKYTIKGWVDNMISYLRSAMSYTNAKTLDDFIGKPELIINSISEINAVNK